MKKSLDDIYLQDRFCNCSKASRGEILVILLWISLKFHLTWEAIELILKLVNFSHDKTSDQGIPETKYKVQKYFPINKTTMKFHLYCSNCSRDLGEHDTKDLSITCECGFNMNKTTKYFISLNFEDQLRDLLEREQDKLDYRFTRKKIREEGIEDVFDGLMYKKLSKPGKILSNKYNLSYTFNTDGCKVANSSKTTLWPIFGSIHELKAKPSEKHVILMGI